MPHTCEEREGQSFVSIEGEMTIYETASLKDLLSRCFAETDGLVLNLEKVAECDLSGIQLLCSVSATSRATGKPLTVEGLPSHVFQLMATAGISRNKMLCQIEEV